MPRAIHNPTFHQRRYAFISLIKYIGMKLTKEVKGLYAENYKTLIKEIREDSKKLKDIP